MYCQPKIFKMKKLSNYIKIAFLAGILVSCGSSTAVVTPPQTNVKEIVKDAETTLVDVRIPNQFQEKTAAGAVNIPLATIQENIDFFKKQKKIVIFCNTGKQAGQAVEILRKNGVKNVYNAKTLKNVEAIKNEKL